MRDAELCEMPTPAGEAWDASAIDEHSAPYLAAWAARYVAPSIIVTFDLAVVWMNGAAARMIDQGEPFCLTAERLACADKVLGEEFRAFLDGLGETPAVWACPVKGGAHLLVRAEALRPANAAPAAALFFIPADTTSDGYVWADLGDIFGLTRSETVVVKRVIAGERADVIAEALGVTLETVRTHIRRVYNKLGIGSREQLFSLINAYRLR